MILETPRLILREVTPDDVDGFYKLDSDAEVHRYLGNQPVTSLQQCKDVIAFVMKQYVDNGIGRWAVVEKFSGDFIGWAGLKLVKEETNGHVNYYDYGYRLIRQYWGKGYASECSPFILQYGFTHLPADIIYGAAHVDNIASNRILRKNGFHFKNTFYYESDLCNWYALEKSLFGGNLP